MITSRFSARAIATLGMLGAFLALPAPGALPNNLTFNNFFGTMTFDRPIHFLEFPGRDSTWVVVENQGRIVLVQRQAGQWVKSTFDSLGAVTGANTNTGTPQDGGLLGFAFHPRFAANGKFYAYHVAEGTPGAIYLVEGYADSTRLKASAQAKRRLLRLQKTLDYHNGGTIYFGADSNLYVSVGDGGFAGGNAGDPDNRAQNLATDFGKILRIDVNVQDAFPADTSRNFGYPPDNPFVNTPNANPEIWALGVRSPWRWSFHPLTQAIWLGDVGQWDWEEVNIITKGSNLGWKIKEGPDCFYHLTTCDTTGLTRPVLSIPHPAGSGWTPPANISTTWRANSVSGGVFYFGDTASPFYGTYFWGDEVPSARIFAMKFNGTTPTDTLIATTGFPRSVGFSTDSKGRIFAISRGNATSVLNVGTIRLVESPDMPYTDTPVEIRKRVAEKHAIRSITVAELLNNRSRYLIRGLDGREIQGTPSGTFLVIEKGNPAHRKLMTMW
jgi:glucose/arabinose dehydrogenase